MSTDTSLTTLDGLTLRLRVWTPEAGPRGAIVVTHGHGEHLGRYNHIAQVLCAAGYAVYTYDLRGHGRSGGKKGHSPSFDHYLNDLAQVQAHARAEHANLPRWLLGHSLGGLITLAYVIRRQPDAAGVVVTGPLLRIKYVPPRWKVTMARVLGRVLPSVTVPTELDSSVPMSHDEALLKSMPDQDLPHSLMSMRVGNDLLTVPAEILARAAEVTLPLLMLQGEADGAVDPAATREFFDQAGSPDKTFKLYPGLYHEIMNETARGQVMDDIVAWLKARESG